MYLLEVKFALRTACNSYFDFVKELIFNLVIKVERRSFLLTCFCITAVVSVRECTSKFRYVLDGDKSLKLSH